MTVLMGISRAEEVQGRVVKLLNLPSILTADATASRLNMCEVCCVDSIMK